MKIAAGGRLEHHQRGGRGRGLRYSKWLICDIIGLEVTLIQGKNFDFFFSFYDTCHYMIHEKHLTPPTKTLSSIRTSVLGLTTQEHRIRHLYYK